MEKTSYLLSALLMASISLCSNAVNLVNQSETGMPRLISGNFVDFGIQNKDTVLTLDCQEFSTDPKTSLFYADFRNTLEITFEAQINTNLTEQVFICKEGTHYNESAGIMVGFDPTVERIFAEITDSSGKEHRIWAGERILPGEWIKIKIKGIAQDDFQTSSLNLSVSADGEKWDESTLDYAGPVMPSMASRWVIGRGYPGGYPNSLQVRKGALRNLSISGVGRQHHKGENPIFTDRLTADPACTVIGDRLYAFVGEDCAAPGGWFTMPHWVAYSTKDMKNWECHGVVLKASDFPYANPNGAWAGQGVERNGKVYHYVTLDDTRNGSHAVDVALSNNPLGPYDATMLDR